jgi:hypothetical protein
MKGKISKQELDELRSDISSLSENIVSIKTFIIELPGYYLGKEFSSANPNALIRLIRNFFIIITGSIETRDIELVEIQVF